MKKLIILSIGVLLNLNITAQTPSLHFDGIDDYVDFGPEIINNSRTIEFWFNLTENIDETLENEMIIFGTEIPFPNVGEWHLSFTKANSVNVSGTLRFVIVESQGVGSQVYSDKTSWDKNKWHHVAVVIDEVQGMMMFVDGLKQQATVPLYNESIKSSSANVELGRQDGFSQRFFNGMIDGLRLSNQAIYLEDFEPPCPDLLDELNTIALYNFNEDEGNFVFDEAYNNNSGEIFGASWAEAIICRPMTPVTDFEYSFKISPNPTSDIINFQCENNHNSELILNIYNPSGKIMTTEKIYKRSIEIETNNWTSGVYHFQILHNNNSIKSGKFIKL